MAKQINVNGQLVTLTVEQAVDVINDDYFDDVRGIVEDCKRAIKDGELSSEDEFHDWLHEAVDGTQRTIYTFQARLGMLVTNNPDAYEDELGEKPAQVEHAMHAAMMADVRDMIGDVSELFKESDEDTE